MKKSCKICGKEFEAVANAGYCSDACRRKARAAREEIRKQKRRAAKNYTRTCPICGKEFESMRGEKYCSDRCRVQGQSKPKNKVPKICPVCGKEFFSSYTRHKYCSDECREKRNKLAIGLQPPQEKICPICGNSFLARTKGQKKAERNPVRYHPGACHLRRELRQAPGKAEGNEEWEMRWNTSYL